MPLASKTLGPKGALSPAAPRRGMPDTLASGQEAWLAHEGVSQYVSSRRVMFLGLFFSLVAVSVWYPWSRADDSAATKERPSGTQQQGRLAAGVQIFGMLAGLAFGVSLALGALSVWVRVAVAMFMAMGGYLMAVWWTAESTQLGGAFLGTHVRSTSHGLDASVCGTFEVDDSPDFLRYTRAVCSGNTRARRDALRALTQRLNAISCVASGCESVCSKSMEQVRLFTCTIDA